MDLILNHSAVGVAQTNMYSHIEGTELYAPQSAVISS
jgi:hypothetical protein